MGFIYEKWLQGVQGWVLVLSSSVILTLGPSIPGQVTDVHVNVYSETFLKWPLKAKFLMTNASLMKVNSIAE